MIRFANTKLIIDPSMGKLVRWLRFLGFDTEYNQDLNMHRLVLRAKKECRILLSCSENTLIHAQKEHVSAYYVPNSEPKEQLKTLTDNGFEFNLPDFDQTRCPNCNQLLALATIDEEQRLVPTNTMENYSEFYICRDCDQIYWKGSHWENILDILQEITGT